MPTSDAATAAAAVGAVVACLRDRFGERLQTGLALRQQHGHTTTWLPTQPPDAVVYPDSTAEVAEIVARCAAHGVPVIPYGIGSSLEGQVNAPEGGICLDMSRMNRIRAVHAEDMDCTVEPGVTRTQLNAHLRDTGLFFPIDPGADATIGGMAATRASGTNAVRYGTMKDNVLALEAVLPDGRIVTTARRARKSSAGYDLTRLLVGAEGTLGVITAVTLRLHGIPEASSVALCAFPDVGSACQAVIATMQCGIPVARIELMDGEMVAAVNRYARLDLPERPLLLLEFHGSPASVAEQSDSFGAIAAEFGGGGFRQSRTAEERAALWKARHEVYFASLALRPGAKAIATDLCVPISQLAACVTAAREEAAARGLIAPIVGHVGDGNFHMQLLVDLDDPEEVANCTDFVAWLSALAWRHDGTCTGEHGIGQGKRSYLEAELGEAVAMMRAIKHALDPKGIMNPGKIFP